MGRAAFAFVAIAIVPMLVTGCPSPGGEASSPEGPRSFNPMAHLKKRDDALAITTAPQKPAVRRKGAYAGFVEEFNRYYSEPGYTPKKTVWVSPNGGGNGENQRTPTTAKEGLFKAPPGTRIVFAKGSYSGCLGYDADGGGTYDDPIIIYGERNSDGTLGVRMQCCGSGRASCFNFEGASYVAIDGFEMHGGQYAVRAVGADYDATQHSKGIAVLNSVMDGQGKDGVLTGAADWAVFENNVASNSGEADGHGIYLSNGSDYNIVRGNDLWGNEGATFQINADPLSTCDNTAVSESCDAIAGTGEGGRGASDFMLVENNYFHHGTAQGSNFTSMRYSVVRNNVFASWGRHGVSFWSETADKDEKKWFNPKLGSHHNRVHHNLFVSTNDRHMLQFINNSGDCDVRNNLFVGMTVTGKSVRARATAIWMETDESIKNNVYENNVYIGGKFDGRPGPNPSEKARQDLLPEWFTKLPIGLPSSVNDFKPVPGAPFLKAAPRLPSVTFDREGRPRGARVDVGPFELP